MRIWGGWFLYRFRPGHHGFEIDKLAAKFRFAFRPDDLKGCYAFLHQAHAGLECGAVVRHFLSIPAGANAQDHPTFRQLIQSRHFLCKLQDVALNNQANAST